MASQSNYQKDGNIKSMTFALNQKLETNLSAPPKMIKAQSLDSAYQNGDHKQKILNQKPNINIETFSDLTSDQNQSILGQTQSDAEELKAKIKFTSTKSVPGFRPYCRELKANQDTLLFKVNLNNSTDKHLFLLADGHGEFGSQISSFATQDLSRCIQEQLLSVDNQQKLNDAEIRQIISQAFNNAQSHLELNPNISLQESGSTMNVLLAFNNNIISANIGDTRSLYFSRNIKPDDSEPSTLRIKQLSIQHTPERPNELQRIINNGGKIEQDTQGFQKTGPLKIKSKKIDIKGSYLTRTFGDMKARQVGVISEPEINIFQLKQEGFLILATGSILEMIDIIDICRILTPITPPNSQMIVDQAAEEIIAEARKKSKLQPDSQDDYSLILVYIQMD